METSKNDIELDMSCSDKVYNQTLNKIPVLAAFIDQHLPNIQQNEKYSYVYMSIFHKKILITQEILCNSKSDTS